MKLSRTATLTTAIFAAALGGLALGSAGAVAGGEIQGTWLSADGGAKVKINPCGNGICGNIIWLREPIDRSTGKPKTDKHNPNEARRSRPMLGLQVMSGMRPDGDNRWAGTIYNADDGKTYRSKLTLLSPNQAKVEGCVLIFCKGETWTKAD
jgi:uncharacterized protein (DUF2147 family)